MMITVFIHANFCRKIILFTSSKSTLPILQSQNSTYINGVPEFLKLKHGVRLGYIQLAVQVTGETAFHGTQLKV